MIEQPVQGMERVAVGFRAPSAAGEAVNHDMRW